MVRVKLSVIIPCLNAAATLPQQLEALAAQQWSEPWELIIADNGSTDDSVEIALKHRDRFPAFRIIDAPARKTASHPRNVGVRVARADRLAFCDADDEVAPGWVAALGDALGRYGVVHGKFRFDKLNDPRQAEQPTRAWAVRNDGLVKGRFLPGGGTGNLGIRRWIHEAIGGFDESLPRFMDADYFWRLQLEGFELHYVPEAVVQVRIGRVNPSLSYLYRRGRTAAASNYWHYKRYRHLGMLPPPPLKQSIANWLGVVRNAASASLQFREGRGQWLKQFAQQTGDLVGHVQGRITNPCKPYHPHRPAKQPFRNEKHEGCSRVMWEEVDR